MVAFAREHLPRFDAILPVDVVVPCAHGSSLALMDDSGTLVLPFMDYEAEPPEEIARGYAAIEPAFGEVFAPTNPGALTLGLQLHWQETLFPEEFRRVRTIVPGGQYYAFALSGRAVTEVSALGAQTHLIDVRSNAYSSLTKARGWDRLFAPVVPAWSRLGPLKPEFRGANFRGEGQVVAGVHDSNANFLRYLASDRARFTLLSTGTWIIGFDTEADITGLDPARDTVSNTTVYGKPVASCRFMGGREFATVADGAPADAARFDVLDRLIARGTLALPSFTDSGGPLPGTGGKGRIEGPAAETPEERATLAALYCGLMTASSLEAIGARSDVIVDGPFSQNPVYLAALAAAVPELSVFASRVRNGTSTGAALLGLADAEGNIPRFRVELEPVSPAASPGFADYHRKWAALTRG
ncbi:MAG: hypothetical protein KDJ77_04240 [Rhodobiaceae bacterium]|nr:hypothetical protein [Rhodobiaceae bacterium]